MSVEVAEDADVPAQAVRGLNDATQKARQAGAIVVIRNDELLKFVENSTVEVVRKVPGRRKVATRTKRLKK